MPSRLRIPRLAPQLVASLDHAVHRDRTVDIAEALVRKTLCELIQRSIGEAAELRVRTVVRPLLPARTLSQRRPRLQRHRDDLGSRQHADRRPRRHVWCVEGVWHGSLEITPYELVASDVARERYRFESRGIDERRTGPAGSLIPPHEYHTIRNPSADSISVTLHIYRGPMTECSVFRATESGWYERDRRKPRARRDASLTSAAFAA